MAEAGRAATTLAITDADRKAAILRCPEEPSPLYAAARAGAFGKLTAPRLGEWLWEHREVGQSVERFEQRFIRCDERDRNRSASYVRGVGTGLRDFELRECTTFAEAFLGVPVRVLPAVAIRKAVIHDPLTAVRLLVPVSEPRAAAPHPEGDGARDRDHESLQVVPADSDGAGAACAPATLYRRRTAVSGELARRPHSSTSTAGAGTRAGGASPARSIEISARVAPAERPERARRQLHIRELVQALAEDVPADGIAVLGITMEDLCSDGDNLFQVGLASSLGHAGVLSILRYDEQLQFSADERWFDYKVPPWCASDARARSWAALSDRRRALLRCCMSTLVHEAMHTLHLPHCIFHRCIMNGSGSIAEDKAAPHHLCPVCLRKLWLSRTARLSGTAALRTATQRIEAAWMEHRYTALQDTYTRLGMSEQATFVGERLWDLRHALAPPRPRAFHAPAPTLALTTVRKRVRSAVEAAARTVPRAGVTEQGQRAAAVCKPRG